MAFFTWSVATVVSVACLGLSLPTGAVLNIYDIRQYFGHLKSSSVSQLIKGKSRDLQKLLKYFNGATTAVFYILLLAGVLPINFALHY